MEAMASAPDDRLDDPRASLALWLRAGRAQRKLSLDEVARITKIQRRVLEKLENGQLDGLPAEVFVRGFVRSFARCVGLDESEAIERLIECFGDCTKAGAIPATSVAKVIVQKLAPAPIEVVIEAEPAPVAEPAPIVEVAPVVEAAPVDVSKKKRNRKKPAATTPPRGRRRKAGKTDAPVPVLAEGSVQIPPAPEAEPVVAVDAATASVIDSVTADAPVVDVPVVEDAPVELGPVWRPTMPAPVTTPSVPWRRTTFRTATASAPATPSLVIDDADPDLAEREQSRRAAAKDQRVSFLPPILLDRDDRSQRQGGLTLAVIILLIAATLTLSYLMRRPTVSGDGVTMSETHSTLA